MVPNCKNSTVGECQISLNIVPLCYLNTQLLKHQGLWENKHNGGTVFLLLITISISIYSLNTISALVRLVGPTYKIDQAKHYSKILFKIGLPILLLNLNIYQQTTIL